MPQSRVAEMLLVEDNQPDVRLTMEALKESNVRNRLHVVSDGFEAMAFLRREGRYDQMPLPDLILLDLNLPRKNGREVLEEIKSDDELQHIPVVILTTSHADSDILRSYRLGANAFVTKPMDLGQFLQAIRSIEEFWLRVVRLPHV